MTTATPRIYLVDDNPEFRESAAWWLEGLGYEVSAFEGPSECLAALDADGQPVRPACFLFDVRMPQMSGLQLLDAVRQRGMDRPVIFMTGHGDVPLAVEAMRKGALTFLEKPFQEDALEDALRRAFTAPDPERSGAGDAPAVPAAAEADDPEYRRRLALLTPREREVMELVVLGHPNKVVAYRLGVSPKTIELHRSRVMAKMGAVSFTQLVRMAMSRSVEGA